jgi:hypothetical protein
MIVTVEIAQRLLDYEHVTLTHRRDESFRKAPRIAVFSALPDQRNLPAVDIYFNDECDVVDIVSFGHWHGHYDTAGDEEKNTRNAFRSARELVKRKVQIINQFTRNGKYLGSDGHRPGDALPSRLHNAEYAERLVFGLPIQRITLPLKDKT